MKTQTRQSENLKFLEPMITSIFWVLLFASPLLFGDSEDGIGWTHIINVWKDFIFYLALFLINRFILLPYLFFRNKRLLYFAGVTLLVLFLSAGIHLIQKNSRPSERDLIHQMPPPPHERLNPSEEFQSLPPGRHNPGGPMTPPKELPPFISFFIISILIVGFDTGLNISMRWAQSEKDRINAEKVSIESQLAFLRNQVSPHFFMNTLNNIHALIDLDTEEAKDTIIRLSKLMRHLLYDSEIERIPISKELDFITNYVDLMKMRYSDKVKIDLKLPEQSCDKLIPPLLFTSYVENAFKHGISYQNASYIKI
jgi:hypothetical protein